MFIIEDEIHAEQQEGKFETFEQALTILKSRAEIPYDQKPNRCPYTNWKNCERQYQIIEYNDNNIPWNELDRQDILTVSAKGIMWNKEIKMRYYIV